MSMQIMGQNAKNASRALRCASSEQKNKTLKSIADALRENSSEIIAANVADLENGRKNGLTEALIDRLSLSEDRINGIASAVEKVISLQDPIGTVVEGKTLPNGLIVNKVRVPLGVVGIIYEARPNVTADAAALCMKSGNAVILRGGKEAINSNIAISGIMRRAVESSGLPADCIQLVHDTSRETATEMMKLNGYIDVLIPRGGAGLINSVVRNATVPVIETGVGNCHIYIDESADFDMANEIVFNAKTSRPSVCNACETVLVHRSIAKDILPLMKKRLDEKNVEIRGDEEVCAIISDAKAATEDDWYKEYLDYILAVKVVGSIDEAIDHIAKYSSGHSECIITGDYASSRRFLAEVDSAAVYVNASTRFTDGGEFGLGAEIGISTQKLHARGPMGLNELTSFKYTIMGSGQIR